MLHLNLGKRLVNHHFKAVSCWLSKDIFQANSRSNLLFRFPSFLINFVSFLSLHLHYGAIHVIMINWLMIIIKWSTREINYYFYFFLLVSCFDQYNIILHHSRFGQIWIWQQIIVMIIKECWNCFVAGLPSYEYYYLWELGHLRKAQKSGSPKIALL